MHCHSHKSNANVEQDSNSINTGRANLRRSKMYSKVKKFKTDQITLHETKTRTLTCRHTVLESKRAVSKCEFGPVQTAIQGA